MTRICDRADFELRLRQSVTSASQALEFDQFACLQDFYAVISANPRELDFRGLKLPDQADFEALLLVQGFDSAALSFLTGKCGFMLSRGGAGKSMASIVLTGMPQEATAEASTPALSVIAAIAIALLGD